MDKTEYGLAKLEQRILALEHLVCAMVAANLLSGSTPRKTFEILAGEMKRDAITASFPGRDPSTTALLSGELEEATDRLIKLLRDHLKSEIGEDP